MMKSWRNELVIISVLCDIWSVKYHPTQDIKTKKIKITNWNFGLHLATTWKTRVVSNAWNKVKSYNDHGFSACNNSSEYIYT